MAEELTEEQKAKKTEALKELVENCAEAGAKTFEDFLSENPNASLEEKHKKLAEIIKSNFMLTTLMAQAL